MALTLFMDSFDYYATEHIGMKWLYAYGFEILPTSGRNGGGCIAPTGQADMTTPEVDSASGISFAFAVKKLTASGWYISLMAGENQAAAFDIASDGALSIGSGIDNQDFAYQIPDNVWCHITVIAQNTAGTLTGEVYVSIDTINVIGVSYSISTEETGALSAVQLSANGAGAFHLDDFFILSGIASYGDMRVVTHEADDTAANFANSWTASDGTSALHDCVNANDSAESLYIKTICDETGNGPNLIEFSSSSLSPLPDTYGTQIVAWMSVDNDAVLSAPSFQVDGGDFGAYTPTSATMEGTTFGYVGLAPGTFGYRGNE